MAAQLREQRGARDAEQEGGLSAIPPRERQHRLQVARQNLEQTSHEDEGMRGERVKVGWRREHTVAVAEQQGVGQSTEEET